VDQAGARSTNVVNTVGSFGTKSTRSASAYLTLRPGIEAGWSVTYGKLESGSEASVGAREETTTKRAYFAIVRLGEGRSILGLSGSRLVSVLRSVWTRLPWTHQLEHPYADWRGPSGGWGNP
jgi:hypothetical protein